MSNAVWHPSSGQWGIFGSAGSSRVGKIRRAVETAGHRGDPHSDIEAPFSGGTAKGELPTTLGSGMGFFSKQSGRPIPGAPVVDEYITSEGPFKQWYNKYREFAVTKPIEEMTGTDSAGEFVEASSELTALAGPDWAGKTGYLAKDSGIGSGYTSATTELNIAETAREKAKKDLDVAEQAEKEKYLGAKEDISRARIEVGGEATERAFSESEAVKAATGMSYSAPAEKAAGRPMGEVQRTMSELALKEQEAKTAMESNIEEIEGERDVVETDWLSAQNTYASALDELFNQSTTAVQGLQNQLDLLIGAHRTAEATTGDPTAFRNIGGGFFTEDILPGESALRDRLGIAEDFSRDLQTQAQAQLKSISEQV